MWPEGQLWKPGPTYPATVVALPPAPLFRIRIFCSRGSLTPVAAPNASPNVFLAVDRTRPNRRHPPIVSPGWHQKWVSYDSSYDSLRADSRVLRVAVKRAIGTVM